MPALPTIQPSFAAGELSPFLHGRVDLAKFHVGCRTLVNFFVHPHGGASNRPGTRFVGAVDDSTIRHRLIPFQFRTLPAGQSYALLFGNYTMQVVMNGGFVLDGTGTVYTVASPYAASDLPTLKFVQSADTMTLTHPNYPPQNLTRTGHANWTFTPLTFAPATAAPTGLSSNNPGTAVAYVVTAVNATSGEESLPSPYVGAANDSSTLGWVPVAVAGSYNVYKLRSGSYGFIGRSTSASFTDSGIVADISNTPPGQRNPFSGSGNYPACSTYYLQRQAFANTTSAPQTLWFSVVGAFNNMTVSTPTKDSDAITRALVSRQVDEIRHLVPLASLLIMTSGAEWRCWPGPSQSGLTPAQCMTLPQTAFGCSHVPPVVTDNSLLFVQEKGNRVQALRYDALQDVYTSQDMSVLASHLLYDTTAQYQIQEWAFAQEPFRIIWAVRSDGMLLGFTYMREHEVYAWHRHVTDGQVESVCAITESNGAGGTTDAVYLIVNRTIGGVTKRYVERMAERVFSTAADFWFVDCGLQYSGAPVTQVSGLGHLEGKAVAIVADGSVVPNQVVTSGAVTLDGAYSKVTVGLPYTAQLETLNLEPAGGGTLQGQMKKIAQVTVRVKDARGIQVGLKQGALAEVKQRSSEQLGTAMQPFTGDWQISIPSEWNREGRLFVQQGYPLPCTILDLISEVTVGD
ncbi:hypothetical protein SAMN02745126_05958 [Enhydrobacter aerosaccus]|uniref:Uncharacterized protein n=1 Tax=Enhydrobacter aerosaccus TaxID=225324 RepID=A0A1T4TBK4_9HYPH|nr:hypothetical protein [Enhydrobacter aerosaccus]SKA37793.1 hypothetical protein SAMN02745126_05958 [Enhydrobacter aerosaccus]